MTKFLSLTLLAFSGLLLCAGVSEAGRRHRCCCCSAPAPVPAEVAPAPPTTASAPQAYRSYSYEPAAAPVYNNTFLRNWGGHAYENAINKGLGRVN
jgi:hypothetical protein